MKRIPIGARLVAGAGLLAVSVLAVTALHADPATGTAGHAPVRAVNIEQRPTGTMSVSKKTVFNLRGLAAAGRRATPPHQVHSVARNTPAAASAPLASSTTTATAAAAAATTAAAAAAAATTAAAGPRLRLTSAATEATPVDAAQILTPSIDKSYDGMEQIDPTFPPDPNAAAGLTQIVEVVNTRLAVETRDGQRACGPFALNTFFGSPAGEKLTDPRVIYDNVANRFTVIAAVDKQAPPGPGPSLPGFPIIRIAHSPAGDACADNWTRYYLSSISLNGNDIEAGSLIDQPAIGQDRNAFLFGATNATMSGTKFVAFSEPKSCAYGDAPACSFSVFNPDSYATPASSAGNPMITTTSSYFVASVPDVGYKLYRMDNSGNAAQTTLTLQATVGLAPEVQRLTRGAAQPGPDTVIDLLHGDGSDGPTRIDSSPSFDGTRIWYTHTTRVSNHAVVRYGAINTATNTSTSALVLHGPTSDDFNPSIAVGLSGTSRTIFLNWAYVDAQAEIPLSDAVAVVSLGAADPLPIINGNSKHLTVMQGGITGQTVFGDYSSVSIDPVNFSQICAVADQEYFNNDSGKWMTRISRFGAAGC